MRLLGSMIFGLSGNALNGFCDEERRALNKAFDEFDEVAEKVAQGVSAQQENQQ